MGTVYILLAPGFEETEAIVPADLLRRVDANVVLVATEGELLVESAHGLTVTADILIEDINREDMVCLVLPGGARGTELLGENAQVASLIEYAADRGIYIGAICAAPSILGKMRLLDGRNAAVYPGFEDAMQYANISGKKVEHDDIFITAEGMGVSHEFGFKLIEVMYGAQTAEEIRDQVRF